MKRVSKENECESNSYHEEVSEELGKDIQKEKEEGNFKGGGK